jgi:hypothetical protein
MNGFLGSAILEAAIGASLIYFILAIFCTTVNEWLARLVNARACNLRSAIGELLNHQDVAQNMAEGKSFLDAFYAHPLIGGLMRNGEHPPYLPVRTFSNVLIDLATSHVQGPVTFADLETGIGNLPAGSVRTSLLALIQNTGRDLARAQASFDNWFNDAMKRASGWYQRRAQFWNAVIATGITVSLNADTLNMLHRFWAEPALRLQPGKVLGWDAAMFHTDLWGWFARMLGWGLTIAAVSLGSPFWYDVLKKFSDFRSSARAPGKDTDAV